MPFIYQLFYLFIASNDIILNHKPIDNSFNR